MIEEEIRRQVEQFYQGRGEFMIHLLIFGLVNAGLWLVWVLAQGTISIIWPLMVSFGWASGLLAHGIDWMAKSPQRLAQVNRRAEERMSQLYGPFWESQDHAADLERVRQATWKQAEDLKAFIIHASVFGSINLGAWLVWLAAADSISILLPLALLLGWGVGLAAHGANNYFASDRAVVAREQAVQRAMAQVTGDTSLTKPKREKAKRILTDDGELLEVIEDETEEIEARSF